MKKLAILFALLMCIQAWAQKDTTAQQYLQYAKAAYALDENDNRVADWLDKAYNLASNDPKTSDLFMAELCSFIAGYLFDFGFYKDAAAVYNVSIDFYRLVGNHLNDIGILHQNVALCYRQIRFKGETIEIPRANTYSTETFYFRVSDDIYRTNDTVYATILGGILDGLFEESKGYARAADIQKEGMEGRYGTRLGSASIISLDSSLSVVMILLNEPDNPLYDVYPDDGVKILTRLPQHAYKSVLWELSELDVYLKNRNGDPMWDFWQLLPDDTEELELEILHAMVEDIWTTAEILKDNQDIPILFEKIEEGRYKGRTLLNVMQKATEADVKLFLWYILNYPAKYMGIPYNLNETFATWVISNAPTSYYEFIDRARKAKTQADFEAIVRDFKTDIQNEDYMNYLETAAEEARTFQDAIFLNQQLMKIAEIYDSAYFIGWAWFNRGKIHDDWGYDADALNYYSKGLEVFEQINDVKGMAFCANNIGFIYKGFEKYSFALHYYNLALSYKLTRVELEGETPGTLLSVGRSYSGLGEIHHYIANYDSALYNYEKAWYYFDKSGSLDGQKLAASAYNDIASVHKDLGNFEAAVKQYTDQINRYKLLGDNAKVASVTDDLADAYFSLGQYRTAYELYLDAALIKLDLENYSGVGFSLSNCGQAMWNIGDLDSAKILHEMAVDYRALGNDSIGMAYSYSKVAALYVETGEINLSFDFFDKAMGIYLRDGDSVKVAKLLYDVGDAYYTLQDYNNAIKSYSDALPIFERREMKSYVGDCFGSIGSAYYNQKNYALSREYHEKALAIRRESGSKKGIMYSLTDLAMIVQFVDYDNDKAELMLQEALALAVEMNSSSYISYCYEMIGAAYSNRGEVVMSEKYYNLAWNIYKETQDIAGQCRVMNYLGYNLIQKGEFEKGRAMFEEAYTLAMNTGLTINAANSLNSLGEYYYLISDFKNAFRVAYEALDFFKANDNVYGIGNSYIIIGNTHNYMGNLKETVDAYTTADSIYQSVDDQLSRATALNNVGTIFFFQGNYHDALKVFYEAERIMTNYHYKGDLSITTKWNIGEVYYEDNILNESRTWLEEAYRLAAEAQNNRKLHGIEITMGKLAIKQGRLEDAERYLLSSYAGFQKIGETNGMTESATWLGQVYAEKKDYTNAEKYLNEAIAVQRSIDSKKYLWQGLQLLSKVKFAQGNVGASIASLKEAVEIIEDFKGKLVGGADQVKFFAKGQQKIEIYENLVAQLISQNNVDEAFYYQEKMNIEGLREQTRSGGGGGTRGVKMLGEEEDELVELELKIDGIYFQLMQEKAKPAGQRSEAKIKELEDLITVNQKNYSTYLDSLKRANPEVYSASFQENINPNDLRAAREDLPDGIAVVEFLSTPNQVIIFVATYENITARVIDISAENLNGFVNGFYNQIVNKDDLARVNANSEQLYNLLIAPILKDLKGITKIALVPTGNLFRLPFQALGHKAPDGSFRYLIQDYELYYINNLRFVNNRRPWNMENVEILAFGNSDKSLPFAEKEVEMIGEMFSTTIIYLKDQASEDVAKEKMSSYPVVHFATHGNLDPGKFENSYLTMAPNMSKGEDGRFTIAEIRALGDLFSCQLIVLSACNTAVNEENMHGWINNPAKEFISLGAKSVVASLWSVDDQGTNELMRGFYSQLKERNSKSGALQQAQISMINNPAFAHPYFWSAFELIGEWK